jgi:6-phosphogluconate dehydrogenase
MKTNENPFRIGRRAGRSSGSTMSQASDIGLIGLAVMGENLALNIERNGFRISVYNRTTEKVDAFMAGRAAGKNVFGARSLEEFVGSIKRPRRIIMLVKAGAAVDALIGQLLALLGPGDVLIDGGNSYYPDTIRRAKEVEAQGLLYVGSGVSGGEEGALLGPSMMPGGSPAAWPLIRDVFQAICARTPDGEPCCDWIGENGAGHFVKMVHNGIEYGDMQLICETYDVMKRGLGLSNDEIHAAFEEWNRGELDSYLIEITRDIVAHREEDGTATIDRIVDAAGQKGTGKWTVVSALEEGTPLTLIGEAVFARCLSAAKEERVSASKLLPGEVVGFAGDKAAFVNDLRQALYASKLVSYAQGYQLMRDAAKAYGWNLNYGGIAMVWRGGCIIRSAFLGDIKKAFDRDAGLVNLLVDPFFSEAVTSRQAAWRRVVARAVEMGIPVPCMGAALAYFDGYRSERLPANLLQAQRDYFGAHTYERSDRPRGEFFHTNWTGRGGTTTSQSYSV